MTTKITIITLSCAILLTFSCEKNVSSSDQRTVGSSSVDQYIESSYPVVTAVSQPISPNIGGYLESLPASYALHPGKRYPLLIFLEGIGGTGPGTVLSLTNLERSCVFAVINKHELPPNITVNGVNYQFITIEPQFKYSPYSSDINDVLNFCIKKYRVDTSKVYMSGVSLGGGALWDYTVDYGKRLSAIVPIAAQSWPELIKGQKIAQSGVCVWAFHNLYDPHVPVSYTEDYVKYINESNPRVPARMTIFPDSGHNAWKAALDPTYRENGQNVYEWMLSTSDVNY
jgi:predicted peptidase